MEKPTIRPYEKSAIADTAERAKRLAPHIHHYAGRLAAPTAHMSDGRPLYLADPPEHGYVIGDKPEPAPVEREEDLGVLGPPISQQPKISITDGVPIIREAPPNPPPLAA
jgi:hypothetical protein